MFESPRARAPRVPVEERLFSLVLALLSSEQGLTKSDVLSTVQGYRQRYRAGGDNASLERQFERDKDDIRELGIPLETIETPGEAGNNQMLRYRIPKGEYDLPAELSFSPAEITMLSLASAVWREGSLSADSQRALHKLASLGVEPTEPLIGYAPRVRTRESAFAPLTAAMEKKLEVSFTYFKPGDPAPRTRVFAPLALVQHEGRWHAAGIDRGAGEPRTFLLSRILGPVVTSRRGFAEDGAGWGDRTLAALRALHASQVARLRALPGSEAERRLGERAIGGSATPAGGADRADRSKTSSNGTAAAGGGEIEVNYTDRHILADELAGYGPEVLVEGPPELRALVIERLRASLAAHDPHHSPDHVSASTSPGER